MPRFNVGDTVKCQKIQPEPLPPHQRRGAGFVADMTFTIDKITMEESRDPVYWPISGQGVYRCGVFEHELEYDWDG